MNLSINPMTSLKSMPKFTGYTEYIDDNYRDSSDSDDNDYKVDYDTYESDLKRAEIKGFNEGFFSGALGMTLLGVIFGATGSNNETKQTNEFIDNISKIASSDSIKQNEFSVKDMNKDNHPDLVLYKKDGSKVIVDLKNQQINTKQKKLDVIK